jgi:hypothetical protein
MDANDRVISRLERLYSLYGASDQVDAVVSVGGHAYRKDIRQAAYRFINTHLKGDGRPVTDSEVDIVSEGSRPGPYPIPPDELRVFPTDADIPADQLNTKIDESFVPVARVEAPAAGEFDKWRRELLSSLRRQSFGYFPDAVPAAAPAGEMEGNVQRLRSEEGIEFRLIFPEPPAADATGVLLVVLNEADNGAEPEWVGQARAEGQAVVFCEPRGIGGTKWTTKNPPNYVERSHALLGRTADTGRVWDVIAAARWAREGSKLPVHVAGGGAAGVIAAYAAALDDKITGATLVSPPASHMGDKAPQFLNVLRVCDIPDALGLIAPRPLTVIGSEPDKFERAGSAYAAAGAKERLSFK